MPKSKIRNPNFSETNFRIPNGETIPKLKQNRQSGSDSSLGVTRVMALNPFGQQTFAPTLATARERGAAALGFHAGEEAVLAFAGALGRLVSAFHKAEQFSRGDFGAVTVEMARGLSIARKLTVDLAFAHCQRPHS